ncbi:MAG: alpha/beta hydrolase [Candidatus Rokubacteria bacterium]|nr:alpha/beta hydrolase [Candidatus Rokubacteria bacterium]
MAVTGPAHRTVETNGIRMHIAEQGAGPLVVLCHGFPESWYSWRHQLGALARAGYRAVAPDMRGYGGTDAPAEIERYTQLHHVGDMVGLLDALGEPHAVIVGHDWGAPVAWNAALLRPDRFRAVAALSVPFAPRGSVPPTRALRAAYGDRFMYMLYFQSPGVAEAELDRDPRTTLRRMLYAISGDAPAGVGFRDKKKGATLLDGMPEPATLPSWLTEADVDVYAADFARTGFRGGLNWYRNLDRTWELMAPWHHATVSVPALFVAGDRDPVIAGMMRSAFDQLPTSVPGLRRTVLLSGCGHWTQQERPEQVTRELLAFLGSL